MTSLLILYLFFGILLILLSIPLLLGKIKPNGLYGFRIPRTMDHTEIWYPANRYAAKFLLTTGIAFTLAAILLYFIPGITVDQYAIAVLVVFLVFMIPGVILSFRFIKNLPLKE